MSQVTVGERVLVHLASYLRFLDAFECPKETTQDGVARALGISRAHAALELKRLRGSGRVEERVAHVAGARTRRKVYFLTPAGAAAGRALRDHARAKAVLLQDGGSRREATGAEAISALRGRGLRESDAVQAVLGSDLVDLARDAGTRAARPLPVPEPFVGRDAELADLRRWLASPDPLALVLGVPGVGKTALACRAAAESPGPVWYRRLYGFEDAPAFAAALADFLDGIERPRLRTYLAGGGFDAADLSALLQEELRGVLLVADDVHASPGAAGFLRLALDTGGAKVLATARERPVGLGGPGTTVLALGGLPPADARALVEALAAGRDPSPIVAAARGHPLALRLLATAPGALPSEAERVLEDAVLDGLDPDLESAALALAVLRKPAARPADLDVTGGQARRLLRRGLASSGPGGIALHDLVREVLVPRAPPASLRAAHRRAARMWARAGDPLERAHHLAASGLPRTARDALLDRGADLLDSPSVGELARLLETLPPTASSRLLLAEAWDRLRRSDDATRLALEVAEAPRSALRAEANLLLGRIASRRNALPEAAERLEAAIAGAGTPDLEGRARRVLALVRRKAGDLAGAEAELGRAIPLLTSPRELLRARLERAIVRLQQGDLAAAASEFEALLREPARGPREEAAILSNLAIARQRAGRSAEAARLLEDAADAAGRGGDVRAAAYALANAADAYLAGARVAEADDAVRRARDAAGGVRDPLLESTILTNEGKVLAARGDTGAAEERLRAGVERIRDQGNVISLAERVRELAEFYEAVGRRDEAARWREESEVLLRPNGGVPRAAGGA